MMEEILASIEQQLCSFHILDENVGVDGGRSQSDDNDDSSFHAGQAFESLIKMNGKPIPPPVMTKQKRLEMRALRGKAVEIEQELANQRRLKLLEKVQTIVSRIEERRSTSQASQVDVNPISVEPEDSRSPNPANLLQALDNPTDTNSETVNHTSSIGHPNQNSSWTTLDPRIPHLVTSLTAGISSAQGSTSSSSDVSLLNQTVVAASDFSPKDQEGSGGTPIDSTQDKSHTLEDTLPNHLILEDSLVPCISLPLPGSNISKSDSSFQIPLGKSPETSPPKTDKDEANFQLPNNVPVGISKAIGSTASVKLACSWNQDKQQMLEPELCQDEIPAVPRFQLMPSLMRLHQDDEDDLEPFGERETYLSLLGEYSSLPMPGGSSHFFSDVSVVPSSTPLENPSPIMIEKLSEDCWQNLSKENSGDVAFPNEEESSVFLSISSTLQTNSAGLSCTLPSNLRTISAASTLQDVDDPWNTLTETPLPTCEDFHLNPDISAPRGTPVGQEDGGSNPVSVTKSAKASVDSTGNETGFFSPEKRVRRNSYTLDHPSPALLSAQARNEAPHASVEKKNAGSSARRSLELNKDTQININGNSHEAGIDTVKPGVQKTRPTEEFVEEKVLHQQLQYFEEMRLHLEQQQRQQLQQLLMEQQQAQMALQQEMVQLERRLQQQQQQQHQQDTAEGKEDRRAGSREDRAGRPREGAETKGKVFATSVSPASVSSNKSTPKSSQKTPSPVIASKQTSPSSLNKVVSPAVKPASTVGSGVRAEPFYLGGDPSRFDGGASVGPVTARSPGVGENISTQEQISLLKINSPTMCKKLDKISAAAKGYLTRRVFKTQQVQSIIKTIKDSVAFADKFISETPIKKGGMSMQDMALAERVLAQVRAAQYDLYDIFFTLPIADRMSLIEKSKRLIVEGGQTKKVSPEGDTKVPSQPLSSATVKALERKKKAREAEARLFGDMKSVSKAGVPSSRSRPVSVAEGRILKPLLSQRSPARPASTNTYRPSSYGLVISQDLQKSKDIKKLTHDPGRPKFTAQKAPGNVIQGVRAMKTRSPVAVKTKGVRRSLYPITNPAKKVSRRTVDVKK
ncbi:uncharacterized protein LOC110978599 isoform X2 [Acanthaster planci]|uniref:Uncharacterized protein LOC110978599 isoform X2 n=1 Tax=Acanthaster planci TaxID=133434 RepID=A0A8B7YCK3_ACAPL|nr:uncharacterized protein LOC110978599 isoform X2 [Acanthaster planci]